MFKIKDRTAVKSFKEFVKKQKLLETMACIDDGECQYKMRGYRFNNFFFTLQKRTLGIYMCDEKDNWVVK